MKYGHYTQFKRKGETVRQLLINEDVRPVTCGTYSFVHVSGRREANKICKQLGAKPWNF